MSEAENTEPQGWRPEPGDTIEGSVTGLDKGWSDYRNGFYPIVTLKTAEGQSINVHCFHAILEKRMMAIAPSPGDRIKVTYHGKRPTKNDPKREVATYTVESDKVQDGATFWGSLGAGAPPAAAAAPATADVPIAMPDDDDFPF